MNLMKALSAILLSCVFGAFVFAQSDIVEVENAEYETPNEAIKIDDFGRMGECQFSGRVDNFLGQLQNNPSATGYIIVYQSESELPARYEANSSLGRIANYLKFRDFDESRIVITDGGFRAELSYELWLVPSGAQPPTPTDTVAKPELPTDKSFLYDASYLMTEYDSDILSEYVLPSVVAREEEEMRLAEEEYRRENPDVENTQPSVEDSAEVEQPAEVVEEPMQQEPDEIKFAWTSEKFGEFIKSLENSQGVIIFYTDDALYDTGKLQNFIEQGRNRIAEKSEISADKIQVIFGGYRESVRAEFYIVPENAELPTASPEERPVKEVENAENSEAR
jgi:hypothetical protein